MFLGTMGFQDRKKPRVPKGMPRKTKGDKVGVPSPTMGESEMFTFVIFWYKKGDILFGIDILVPW